MAGSTRVQTRVLNRLQRNVSYCSKDDNCEYTTKCCFCSKLATTVNGHKKAPFSMPICMKLYTCVHLGYTCPPNVVCCLKKSLNGPRPAPHVWFDKFQKVILKVQIHQTQNDHSFLFVMTSCGCIILLLCVDDIMISGNDNVGISDLKRYIMHTVKMKDQCNLTYILELKIAHTTNGIYIHQQKYV